MMRSSIILEPEVYRACRSVAHGDRTPVSEAGVETNMLVILMQRGIIVGVATQHTMSARTA